MQVMQPPARNAERMARREHAVQQTVLLPDV